MWLLISLDCYHNLRFTVYGDWDAFRYSLQVLLTPTHLAILMEYAAGGELFERICNAGRFCEDEVYKLENTNIHLWKLLCSSWIFLLDHYTWVGTPFYFHFPVYILHIMSIAFLFICDRQDFSFSNWYRESVTVILWYCNHTIFL